MFKENLDLTDNSLPIFQESLNQVVFLMNKTRKIFIFYVLPLITTQKLVIPEISMF